MPLLIDAYNLLHLTMPRSLAGLDTAGLCAALDRTRWRWDGVTVVCDGTPGPGAPTESPADSVRLVYAGAGRTADAVILDLIARDTSPKRLTVVSTDRQIRAAARRRRAASWTSAYFLRRLTEALGEAPATGQAGGAGGGAKPRPEQMSRPEVERWLARFGYGAEGGGDAKRAEPGDELDDVWPPW